MEVPLELAAKLAELGFSRTANGRHWELPGTDVFLEAPSATLDSDATVAEVELPSGRTAKVLSRVDVLIDRLAEFQAIGHQIVAQQILMLMAGLTEEEVEELHARASTHRVGAILKAMRKLADDLAAGREPPESDELHSVALAALRAEYPPRRP